MPAPARRALTHFRPIILSSDASRCWPSWSCIPLPPVRRRRPRRTTTPGWASPMPPSCSKTTSFRRFDVRQSLAPTLALGVSLPFAPDYRAGLEAGLITSSGFHSSEGGTETDLGTLRTGSILLDLGGRSGGGCSWRAGLGLHPLSGRRRTAGSFSGVEPPGFWSAPGWITGLLFQAHGSSWCPCATTSTALPPTS